MITPPELLTHNLHSDPRPRHLRARDPLHLLEISSPLGPLRLLATRTPEPALCGVYLPAQAAPAATPCADDPVLVATARQLGEYFAGARRRFDLPLRLAGTDFQRTVWRALIDIPFAATRCYAELAGAIDHPRACRAVGAANGKNPISIIVPCHRVLGRDGSLTGYAGGQPAKRWLLDHEIRLAAGPAASILA